MSQTIAFHASDYIEAHIVRGMLESGGVKAWVNGDFLQGAVGEISPMGIAKVMVLEEDLPLARQILEEYQPAEVPDVSRDDIWNATPALDPNL